MKKIFLGLALICAAPLASCANLTSPVASANQTKLDEQAAIGVNLAYKAFRLAAETGIEAGFIKGDVAAKVASADNRAFAAVQAVDAAYRAGNSTDYASAVANAYVAIDFAVAAVKGAK